MRKKYILLATLLALTLTACFNKETHENTSMTEENVANKEYENQADIDKISEDEKGLVKEIYNYRTDFVGDNSNVSTILWSIPTDHIGFENINLHTDHKPYGITVSTFIFDEGDNDVEYNKSYEEELFKASAEAFSLIGNLDYIEFESLENGDIIADFTRTSVDRVLSDEGRRVSQKYGESFENFLSLYADKMDIDFSKYKLSSMVVKSDTSKDIVDLKGRRLSYSDRFNDKAEERDLIIQYLYNYYREKYPLMGNAFMDFQPIIVGDTNGKDGKIVATVVLSDGPLILSKSSNGDEYILDGNTSSMAWGFTFKDGKIIKAESAIDGEEYKASILKILENDRKLTDKLLNLQICEVGTFESTVELLSLNGYNNIKANIYKKGCAINAEGLKEYKELVLDHIENPDKKYTDKYNEYSIKLASKLFDKDENVIFSPASLYFPMAVLYEGADGIAKDEISNLLSVGDDVKEVYENLYKNSVYENEDGKSRFSNLILFDNKSGDIFNEEFIDNLESFYKGYLGEMDLSSRKTKNLIEKMVKETTDGKVSYEYVPSDDITAFILNTANYEAKWMNENYRKYTKDLDYALSFKNGDDEKKIDTVSGEDNILYSKDENFEKIELSLEDGYSVLFSKSLDLKGVKNIFTDPLMLKEAIKSPESESFVRFRIPLIEIDGTHDLRDTLIDLGCSQIFNSLNTEMFNNMIKIPSYVSDIKQGAMFKLDEAGVSAAAYTAVIMEKCSMPMDEPIKVDMDSPFVFALKNPAGEVIFMGQFIGK